SSFLGRTPAIALLTAAGALAMAVSYVGASVIVSEKRPTRRTLAVATAAGFVVYLPVPYLTLLLVLPAVAWLAFFGLAVPAAVIESLGLRAAFRRGIELGKADFVHAAGSLAALVVVVFLTGSIMSVLLHGGSGQAVRVAAFLASFVVTPLLFLGAALLYYDQAARVTSSPPETR